MLGGSEWSGGRARRFGQLESAECDHATHLGPRPPESRVKSFPCDKTKKQFTNTNPMQPASHRDSHTRPDSAQTQHTTSIASNSATGRDDGSAYAAGCLRVHGALACFALRAAPQ